MTEYIDRETFLFASGRENYFRPRWGFTSRVIERIRRMEPIGRVFELGPGPTGIPIVTGSTTMDFMRSFNPTIVHDARKLPWPFDDKSFDLFISLQTFEHLRGCQLDVFREARRIARRGIITLPFRCRSEFHRIGWSDYRRFFDMPWIEEKQIDFGSCHKYMLVFDFERGATMKPNPNNHYFRRAKPTPQLRGK